jgi:RimJ/RimL family protein N-acetyltransferase
VPIDFPIVTDRTLLRRLSPTDLAKFQSYRRDEEVGRYQGWLPQSELAALDFLKESSVANFFRPEVWFQIGIAERETDVLIGDIGICLSASEPECEIGFTLCQRSQGFGLGREAVAAAVAYIFDETDVHRVIGVTDSRNIAAIKLLQNIGLRHTQTKEAIFRGSLCEEHHFELSRPPD